MRRILLLSLGMLLTVSFTYAQFSKVNFVIAQKLEDGKGNEQMTILVKGNIGVIKRITENAGGVFRYSAGDIASVKISLDGIREMMKNPAIKRMETGARKMLAMNDSMRVNNNIVEVHSGMAPLPQAYDGSGVIMGIVDSGIDFTHPDFKDSKIYIIGHSLGAMTAPLIASKSKNVSGIVLLAGNARPLEDLLLEQYSYLFGADSIDATEKQEIATLSTQIKTIKDPKLLKTAKAEDLPLGLTSYYWQSFAKYNQVHC